MAARVLGVHQVVFLAVVEGRVFTYVATLDGREGAEPASVERWRRYSYYYEWNGAAAIRSSMPPATAMTAQQLGLGLRAASSAISAAKPRLKSTRG